MKRMICAIACVCVVSTLTLATDPPAEGDKYWPHWRGPQANGVAPNANPPTEWSETKNIRWKIDLGGEGHATPIIWGDRVFVQIAVKTDKTADGGDGGGVIEDQEPSANQERQRGQQQRGQRGQRGRGQRGRRGGGRMGGFGGQSVTNVYQFKMMALDRKTGKTVWSKTLREELPHEGTHQTGTFASSSPTTDGEHVYAYFGSRGLYCLDMDGNVKWEKDLGDMNIRFGFGEGSSPVLHGDKLIVNWDHEGQSFITVLNKYTGEQIWKVDRDEGTAWSTPLVVEANGRAQVVTTATSLSRSYDLNTGELIWQCGGMTSNVIPSPVTGHGFVYAISGYRGKSLQAIKFAEAKGDITGSDTIAWSFDKATPYVPSPLLYGDRLYFIADRVNIISCFNAKTGDSHFLQQRLEGMAGIYASPVGAGGRVYVAGQGGMTTVLKDGPEYQVLAQNKLDDVFDASPAIVDNEIFLRGHKSLYCIAEAEQE